MPNLKVWLSPKERRFSSLVCAAWMALGIAVTAWAAPSVAPSDPVLLLLLVVWFLVVPGTLLLRLASRASRSGARGSASDAKARKAGTPPVGPGPLR